MLTPDERDRIAREYYLTDFYDPEEGPAVSGRMPLLAAKFPVPDTAGMIPEQREVVLDRWRAAIQQFVARADAAAAPPVPVRESA